LVDQRKAIVGARPDGFSTETIVWRIGRAVFVLVA
jgi:hypothetical protein